MTDGIMPDDSSIPDDVMYVYTRRQALEDGYQMLLSDGHAVLARQAGWKYPVYLTHFVVALIETAVANKKYKNDWNGVLWHILWMSRAGQPVDDETTRFTVMICGVNHEMFIQCGPTDIDDPAPALTIMGPEDL